MENEIFPRQMVRIIADSELKSETGIRFEELFDLSDIQRLQDEFAQATQVASVITYPDGAPITKPSNFCRLCKDIIRKTEIGRLNCFRSDAVIGQPNPAGVTLQPCLSGGLWDAGAAIVVDGHHIANWLIGQVRDEEQTEEEIRSYARTIGADENAMVEAFNEVPAMSRQQFESVARVLFTFANQLSSYAYQNVLQARLIAERSLIEETVKKNERFFSEINACLVKLGPDYSANVSILTRLCGQLLGATCALYNRLENDMLCSVGQWSSPPDYDPVDKPDGHICYDVIRKGERRTMVVSDLPSSIYFITDPNVRLYSLKTYAGHAVFSGGEAIGSLCVVFQDDRVFDEPELGVLSIIAAALGGEEQRFRDRQALKDSDQKYHDLYTLLRLMADNMPDMLWAKNLNKEFIFANKAICKNLLNTKYTDEPLGKTDLFFARRERESHPEKPEWHTFGEVCQDSDVITLQEMKSMQFDEYGNVKGKFLFLDVHKAPLYDEQGQLIGVVGSARDVTQSKEVEQQLVKLSQAVDQSPASVVITNQDGEIEYVNPKFIEVTGYTMEEARGKNLNVLQSDQQANAIHTNMWETIANGKTWRGELYSKKKNGELFWESASVTPIKNEQGEIINFVAVKENITELKQHHEKIRLTKKTYEHIFNSITEALYVLDERDIFIDVNRGAEIMYGYSRDELIGKSPAAVSAPDMNDLPEIQRMHQEVKETGVGKHFEFWGMRKNGEVFPKEVIINKSNYFGKDCIIATARDITDRKRAENVQRIQFAIAMSVNTARHVEDMLETVRQELGKLFDTTNFFVAMYDPSSDMMKQLIFRDQMDSFYEWPARQSISGYVVKLRKTIFLKGEEIQAFSNNHQIEVLGTNPACWLGVPLIIRNNVVGVMVIQHYSDQNAYSTSDVSLLEMVAHETGTFMEKQQMIADMIIAKEKAEESDRLKTAFLQNMSHEIRTPLNGIIGFSELLNNPGIDTEKRKYYTDIIIKQGWQLSAIINDIITISSLETRQELLRTDEVDVNKLIGDQLVLFASQADKKGLHLTSGDLLAAEDAIVFADKARLGQIINNLILNALKFTEHGEVVLGCQKHDNQLNFYVRDTGIGIDTSKTHLVFERFAQADEGIRQKYGGTGLGLSICKGFVELMGGEIWFESQPGQGATFWFTIPYKPVREIY